MYDDKVTPMVGPSYLGTLHKKTCVNIAEPPKPTPTPVDPSCPLPFKKYNDRCLFVENGGKRPYVDAAKKCAKMGGKLIHLEKPYTFAKNHDSIDAFKHKKFFIGAVDSFENVVLLGSKQDSDSQKVFQLALNAAKMYNVNPKDIVTAFKRFSGKATIKELNLRNPLTTRCLVLNFDIDGIEFVPCHNMQHFVCERVPDNDRDLRWSPWFNTDPLGADGDNDESLSKITKEYQNGLDIPGLSLCSNPIKIECRDAVTKKIYSRDARHGIVMDHACENNRIRCNKTDQANGKACPDFEIRFQCVNTYELDCENALVNERCLSKNKLCRNRAFGPQCEEQKTGRTGREAIGSRKCTYNNIQYDIKQCVARGDPHYITPDGSSFNFHGKCSYNLISSCKTFPENKHFPQFSVVTTNGRSPDNQKVSSTKAFELTIAGTTYSFARAGVFKVAGLKRHMINYEDDNIKITVQMKGGLSGNPKVTIDTNFCLQVTWDNKMALYVRVPHAYRSHVCGMCGNYDSDPKNDMYLPETSSPAWPSAFGRYFQVSGRDIDSDECTDRYTEPNPCSLNDMVKFRKPEFCGVFDPEGKSEFAAYILRLGTNDTNSHNRKMLQKLLNDCVEDHCWLTENSYNRCYEMETSVEEIAQDLNIQDLSILDNMWRQYSNCIRTEQSLCKFKPNSHYEASYKIKCMPTCATAKVPPTACPELATGSGCVCDQGFYLNSKLDCVSLDECEKDCSVELPNGQSFTLKEGEFFVAEPCMKDVFCANGRSYIQEKQGCSTHAKCSADGKTCVCREGFVGDGTSCTVDKSCRPGYQAFGGLCYKMMPKLEDWHSAAIMCGLDGAHLARYDTDQNLELENFMRKTTNLYLESIATRRIMTCKAGTLSCKMADGEVGVSYRIIQQLDGAKGECALSRFDESRTRLFVSGSSCHARFEILTVPAMVYKIKPRMEFWVGGNTVVLGHNKRVGKSPFQVDPPRMIDQEHIGDELGCFQARLNSDNKTVIKANSNCNQKNPFICEYENNNQKPYNPNDIVGINKRVTYAEAIIECKKLGRPLLKITNDVQQGIASKIVALQFGGHDSWLDAKWSKKGGWEWSDKMDIDYKRWEKEPEAMSGKRETHCLAMDGKIKEWKAETCGFSLNALCGPPESVKPTAFTPPVKVMTSGMSLQMFRVILNLARYPLTICDKPLELKCRAKRISDKKWVTSYDQQGKILTCTEKSMSCVPGQGLDCSTLEVQFLCPEVENQCVELKKLGATACDGGQDCLPTTNHYFCKCPAGVSYSHQYKHCIDHCAKCEAYGDPHYTDYRGNKFEFQGECKYKLSGVCKKDIDPQKESWDVFTKNKPCERGYPGTCIEKIEVHIRNIEFIWSAGIRMRGNFIFKIDAGASSFEVNGQKIVQREYNVPGAIEVKIIDAGIFDIIVRKLHLRVFMSGNLVDVYAPKNMEGKLCGLCGDCGSSSGSGFRLRNGTVINLPKVDGRWEVKSVVALAQSWVVTDPLADKEVCRVPVIPPKPCTPAEEMKISDKKFCGIFKDVNGPLKKCLAEKSINADDYYKDCMYDACHQPNSSNAVCVILAAYARKCFEKKIIMDWRTDDFCPHPCKDNEVYRSYASCEPTCGIVRVPGVCNEPAREGCVCRDGYKREGTECVPEDDCGCDIKLKDGTVWQLPIGKWILQSDCSENITCVSFSNGESKAVSSVYTLPNNAICKPGPPPVVDCAKGYTRNNSGECVRDPVTCTDCFRDVDGLCLKDPEGPKIWRHMLQACNEIDGHFTVVDTNAKLQAMKKVMLKNKYKSLYIAGRIVVYRHGLQMKIKPYLNKNETGKIQYLHFDVNTFIMKKVKVMEGYTIANLPKEPLALVVRLDLEKKPIIVAVPTTTKANVTCEQRGTPPDDTTWHAPCNTDKIMSDNGDQELLPNMLLEEKCLVCPHPLEVRCKRAPTNGPKNKDEGRCELRSDGRLYSCSEGASCVDMMVETNCTKDVDECALDKDDCPINSRCINMVGAYRCKCNSDFPLMIEGKCHAASNCSMEGPQIKNGYVFDFNGFSDVAGLFDYDCSYLLAGPVKYVTPNPLPYVSYEVIVSRKADVLHMKVAGTIYHPQGTHVRHWAIDNDLINRKKILFGDSHMFEENLNYHSYAARARFTLKNPNVLIIKGMDDSHYRVRITTNPWTIHLQLSEPLVSKSHGVCALSPASAGEKVYMTPAQADKYSLGRPKCRAYIPPVTTSPGPNPVPATTTVAPVTKKPQENCSTTDFCNVLAGACDITLEHCRSHTCSGELKPCDYLSKKEFAPNCHDKAVLRSMIDGLHCMCKPHQIYDYTIASKQKTCFNPCEVAMEGEDNKDDYEFGCVCAPGYVLSGANCIRVEECGCYTNEGVYKEPGSRWRSSNCTWIYTCGKNRIITKEHAPCGANTTCEDGDSGPECKCIEDHYGNPNIPEGCKPGDGPKVCYNHTFADGSIELVCNCSRGFISNCSDCEDVDECKLGLHDCELDKEVCVNQVGGFICECAKGYVEIDGECKDLNECVNKTNPCNQNEGCVNKVGGYECKCCAGYTYNKLSKKCVRNLVEFPKLPPGSSCCAICNIPAICKDVTSEPKPLCYRLSNGTRIDYKDGSILFQNLCLYDWNFDPDDVSPGPCPEEPVTEEPKTTEATVQPPGGPHLVESCKDPNLPKALPPPPPELAEGPVCGPSSSEEPETFPNYNEMLKAVCESLGGPQNMPRFSTVPAQSGPCNQTTEPPATTPARNGTVDEPSFYPWTPFGRCKFVNNTCGIGVQVRTRAQIEPEDGQTVREPTEGELRQERVCFEGCTDPDTGEPIGPPCPDSSICDQLSPVCGAPGPGISETYDSLCHLNIDACNKKEKPIYLYPGECDPDDKNPSKRLCQRDGPLQTHVRYWYNDTNMECFGPVTEVKTCNGMLCEGSTGSCCHCHEKSPVTVTVTCYSHNPRAFLKNLKHVHYTAKKCMCKDSNPTEKSNKLVLG
jgi:hypothetical protein